MRVEVLYFEGCPNYEALLPRLRQLLEDAGVDDEIELRRVETAEAAERERFLGSPTVRIDGEDVDPGAPPLAPTPGGLTRSGAGRRCLSRMRMRW